MVGLEEHETRFVPVDMDEVTWARRRPVQHRVPRPRPGDPVLYRHNEWDREVHQARLLDYVAVDDFEDPLMWRSVVEEGPLFATAAHDSLGRRLVEPVEDPWPLVSLDTPFGKLLTREARLRGSPGWLPLDWRARFRPMPARLLVASCELQPHPHPDVRPAPVPGASGVKVLQPLPGRTPDPVPTMPFVP